MTIPMSEYRDIVACSFHALLDSMRSPAYAKWHRENPDESTPAMLKGEAFHALVLDGEDAFNARFCLKDFDGRTKEGKARAAEVEAKGLAVLPVDSWDAVKKAALALSLDEVAKPILDACPSREKSVTWMDGDVPMKGRIDAFGPRTIVDVKFTEFWHEDDFPRFIKNSRVDWQLALYYSAGVTEPEPNVYAVAVSPTPPHEVRVYEFDDAMLADAYEAMRGPLARYGECLRTNVWPAGPSHALQATRARWDVADPLDIAL